MKKKITALLAGAYIASSLSIGAFAAPAGDSAADGAGNVIENVGEGAGDVLDGIGDGVSEIADGIGDAAGDVLDGAGDAAEEITGGDPAEDPGEDDTVVNDDEPEDDTADIAEITDDDDVDDDLTDDDDDKAYEMEMYASDTNNRNPATGGLPFMTAGLVAVTAAGVAYLTKKRNIENGQDR